MAIQTGQGRGSRGGRYYLRWWTIAQFLTHTSGITNDPSQGIAFNQFQPFDKPSMDKQFDVALSVPLGNSPGSRYFYNNMNYAALAVVIETVTGEQYGDYGGREVLKTFGDR